VLSNGTEKHRKNVNLYIKSQSILLLISLKNNNRSRKIIDLIGLVHPILWALIKRVVSKAILLIIAIKSI
jgi:hypothetical protein